MNSERVILVGDNAFQGVSHLSQERAISRGKAVTEANYAAELVATSAENGTDGFMFTISDTTLSILRLLGRREHKPLLLYALIPYAYELVRSAALSGGVPGLVMNFAKQAVFSRNLSAIANGIAGILGGSPAGLLKSYLAYEVSRLKPVVGKRASLASVLIHEVVTDMALALNMDWLFATHISFMRALGIKPGFETRNFTYLVKKFEEWGINFRGVVIAASFNPIGFQMCPTKKECEQALEKTSEAEVIAFSILAAGYVKLPEAAGYVAGLPKLKGIAVGVSNPHHARETFQFLKERWKDRT